MSAVELKVKDFGKYEFPQPPSVLEVAEAIDKKLAKKVIAGKIPGKGIIDVRTTLTEGGDIELVTVESEEAPEVMRHSAAHVMAEAVQELWPEVKVTIGPVIENGFYYDFDSPFAFKPEHLDQIEKRMRKIIKRNTPITREDLPSAEASALFEKMGERYKVEIIRDLGEEKVSIYKQGQWFDLCSGPHVQHTGQVGAIKVMSLAGAYWRGDEKREQLQRIYATAFPSEDELKQYLNRLEEAKKRDHRKLGKEMELFNFHVWAPGSPFYTDRGTIVRNELTEMVKDYYLSYGYKEIITPQIFDVELYHQSGHYENYAENMYFAKPQIEDEREFSVKPMNCPGHCLYFNFDKKSYRDLPLRIADFGRLHRYERSGALHGLTRVRTFCQDDAHIFCRQDQMLTEITSFMKMLGEIYELLGMNQYRVFLSTRPEKRLGSDEVWDMAEKALADALEHLGINYQVNEGDGAFYGPKIDIMFVDAIGRDWQLGTLQCDFNMPERFELAYTGEDNDAHRPVMLHRAILGSLERFIGVYLEHTAGHLPAWLAPVQVQILNVSEKHQEYAKEIHQRLQEQGIRAHLDDRNEKLGYKIREAQLKRVPYMLVLGDKEVEAKTLSVRLSDGRTINELETESFISKLAQEVKERQLKSHLAE